MTDAPFRRQFDAARDPYAARNALGITGTGGSGGGAPIDAQYIVAVDDPTLTNDRVLTNTATVTWDLATAGQVKANAVTGGNVSNSGTPSNLQYARWTDATHIGGVAPATVLSDIGAQPAGSYQPLDGDLTSLAGASATNAIYYRSAASTWAPVTIGSNLTFTGGTLAASGGTAPPIPTRQVLTSGSGTYTTPPTCRWIEVELVGGGGGGGGGAGAGNGAAGGNTTFVGTITLTGGGGGGGNGGAGPGGGGGGAASGGDINLVGAAGSTNGAVADGLVRGAGGMGGSSFFGGGGGGVYNAAGIAAATNTGAGGGGGGTTTVVINIGGTGGGAGGYVRKIIGTPAATYSYAVGTAGAGAAAVGAGWGGGNGGSGLIIVTEFY